MLAFEPKVTSSLRNQIKIKENLTDEKSALADKYHWITKTECIYRHQMMEWNGVDGGEGEERILE